MLLFVAIAGFLVLAGALAVISALRRRIDEVNTERARLERAMGDFVATASHELRGPLTSLKGFVELLHHSSENMSERQREFVQIILRSTERLGEMVGELLDFARIEVDRVELELLPIDLADAVREVAELMGPRVVGKRQRLDVRMPPTLPLALADPARLRQIVANLLTNAHLYTSEYGSIRVSACSDGPWVEVSVRDTGVGMTREQVDRVFERFYRAADGANVPPGTGLGLSIVKSLVELHDGLIEVESAPGVGSTFRVLIPAAAPAPDLTSALDAIVGLPTTRPILEPSLDGLGIERRRPITGAPRGHVQPGDTVGEVM
jgi:signal transduction histidine kinase